MRIVSQRSCGMDVRKDSVTACVLLIDEYGELRREKRYFRTMTRGLKEMATWLASLRVEAIATSSKCRDEKQTRRTASGLPTCLSRVY
jgi:transposase